VLFWFGEWCFSKLKPFQIFQVQSIALFDFEFNDLFYRLPSDNTDVLAEKRVVLINAGQFDGGQFRAQMAALIAKLQEYKPLSIALDFKFEDTSDTHHANHALRSALRAFGGDVYIGYPSDTFFLPIKQQGSFVLPQSADQSIRYYFDFVDSVPTLALQVANQFNESPILISSERDSFPLRYQCIHSGFYNYESPSDDSLLNFPALEAKALMSDSSMRFADLIKDKVVIVGWIGRDFMNSKDFTDHFKTPTDTNHVVGRLPIMPGSVIHATAIENILSENDGRFREVHPFLTGLVHHLFLFTLLSIFILRKPPKWAKISILMILSIPYVFGLIFLMHLGWHLPAGSTLLSALVIEEVLGVVKTPAETVWLKIDKIFEKQWKKNNS
jgi:hypothetical protein